jgi:single-strand DNA-binding protein
MAYLNKFQVIGRLTDNPEAPKTLPNSGNKVIRLRIAAGRSKKNAQTGEWENDPNPLYIDAEAFAYADSKRDLVALLSQYAKKGDQLYLEGRLQLDQWEDKNGGGKRSKHKLVIENVEFIGTKTGGGDAPAQDQAKPAGKGGKGRGKPAAAPADDEGPADAGDIPF